MSDYARAFRIFERAITFAKQSNAPDLEAIALSNLAIIESHMQHAKAAHDLSNEAVNIIDQMSLENPEFMDV